MPQSEDSILFPGIYPGSLEIGIDIRNSYRRLLRVLVFVDQAPISKRKVSTVDIKTQPSIELFLELLKVRF